MNDTIVTGGVDAHEHGASSSTQPGTRSGRLNALTAWAPPADSPLAIKEIRLDGNLRCLIPFTAMLGEVTLHYVEYTSVRGYLHCNGDNCVLCRIGRQREVRHLLPVYDPIAQAVGVLPVSTSIRPGALQPQLFSALKRLDNNERILLGLRKPDRTLYEVQIQRLADDVDDGARIIQQYLESDERGEVALGTIYQRLDNDLLAQIPEVDAMLRMRGVTA
jgi:hypothetical protein